MPGRTKPLLISPSIPTVAPCVSHHSDVTHEAIRVRPRGRIPPDARVFPHKESEATSMERG
eukprot:873582-Prymnesium_polylepis.1